MTSTRDSTFRTMRPELTRFETFAEAHYEVVQRVLRGHLRRRRLPVDVAEDLAQDVFLAVWRQSRGGAEERVLERAYVLRAARNAVTDFARGAVRRAAVPLDGAAEEEQGGFEPSAAGPGPWERLSDREEIGRGYGAVGNWKHRAAMVLTDIYGCDVSDCRQVLGLGSDNAVYVNRRRGRDALKDGDVVRDGDDDGR